MVEEKGNGWKTHPIFYKMGNNEKKVIGFFEKFNSFKLKTNEAAVSTSANRRRISRKLVDLKKCESYDGLLIFTMIETGQKIFASDS